MRYTIETENSVKKLAEQGYDLDYITAKTGIPKKVIWSWCPSLRPHDDIIKQSVKQRYHFIFPDYEAKITTAFSPFINENIDDDEWENANNIVYDVLFDLAEYVFRNAITDLPQFSDVKKLCSTPFLQYCREFWDYDTSEYIKDANKEKEVISRSYADSCKNVICHWSFLKKKSVKDVTKGDLQLMQEKLVAKNFSPSWIYFILRAGIAPLKYAYEQRITLNNINEFKMPRKIRKPDYGISTELKNELFSHEWDNELAFFANYIACEGHLRLNELKGITVGAIIHNELPRIEYPLTPYIDIECVVTSEEDIEENPHPKKVFLPDDIYERLINYIIKNNLRYEEFPFWDGKKRNTWNDELKKEASKYSDEEVNFAMWS